MNRVPQNIIPSLVVQRMKKRAQSGLFHGTDNIYDQIYLRECTWWWGDINGCVIFTRDVGHHSCGWFKNPDYERCWHLSLSFQGQSSDPDSVGVSLLLDLFFGDDKRLIWTEPPYSDPGKKTDVYHYRLFCDENWEPIKPRGEVYSRDFTEKGWKSYSEVMGEKKEEAGQ